MGKGSPVFNWISQSQARTHCRDLINFRREKSDGHKFTVVFTHVVSSRTAWATEGLVSKTK